MGIFGAASISLRHPTPQYFQPITPMAPITPITPSTTTVPTASLWRSPSGPSSPSTSHSASHSAPLSSDHEHHLRKTTSMLGLSKSLNWGRGRKNAGSSSTGSAGNNNGSSSRRAEERYRRKIQAWEREDRNEWDAPSSRGMGRGFGGGPGRRAHQEVLRAFAFERKNRPSIVRESESVFSGISPGCSRMNSFDEERVGSRNHSLAASRAEVEGLAGRLAEGKGAETENDSNAAEGEGRAGRRREGTGNRKTRFEDGFTSKVRTLTGYLPGLSEMMRWDGVGVGVLQSPSLG
ncbi:hypothetical protein LZ554_006367 [Drepanopeziza brunnea f. sp. 'monogermtubi']|nr:hypothetical protein LZ554_006367 [Drepanopeziza brunnea f. sp. 'monogermtubi']